MRSIYFIFIAVVFLFGCKKQNKWLDEKRQQSDIVPSTLTDYQAILDNTLSMNAVFPTIGQIGADNFYFPDENAALVSGTERNAYVWSKNIFEDLANDYYWAYACIANANIVLDGLSDLSVNSSNQLQYNSVKGQALFFRAIMFSEVASLFCKPFDNTTASTDPGICLRTTSNINHIEPRSSVKKTYDQIINDLLQAVKLLPVGQSFKTRPSRPSAFALLARVHLLIADYSNAIRYADSALKSSDKLLDFNNGIVSLTRPNRFPDFATGNDEILFFAYGWSYYNIVPDPLNTGIVDTVLYASYVEDDLRRTYFYNPVSIGKAKFRGTYAGTSKNFTGLATNEVYFIRAECNARLSNVTAALSDLNKVLAKRFKTGTYVDFATDNADIALVKILEERRKEFPFTGLLRWQDLRRLNKEARFAKTLTRKFLNTTYQLLPDDKRYVYPIPQEEINKAGIEQNER